MRKPGIFYLTTILWLIVFAAYGLINFIITPEGRYIAIAILFLFVATIFAIVYYVRYRR